MEEGEEVNEEQSTVKVTPRVNNEETKTQKKKAARKGTSKQFSAIRTEICKKIRTDHSEISDTICRQYLENKEHLFYDLRYTAAEVFEELEALLKLEAEQILAEITPDTQEYDDATPRKKSKRESEGVRAAVGAARAEEVEDADMGTDVEAGHYEDLSETETQNGADPPATVNGQQNLITMWGSPPPTSKETNHKQDGENQ